MASEPIGELATTRLRDLDVAYRLTTATGRPTTRDRDAAPNGLVVMIHGLGQDHRIWDQVRGRLGDRPTLAYDLRGHGGTTLGEADGTIDQLDGDLAALLEHFGPATVIGFSLGGVIALRTAASRPELVERVVAVATSSVVGSAAATGLDQRIATFEAGDRAAIAAQMLADTRAQLAGASDDAEAISAVRLAAVGDGRGYVNAARAVRGIRDHPINDALETITAPVLVIGGELDVWCPRRAAEIMLEHLPTETRFEELPQVGHLITDVAPERLSEVIRVWLPARESATEMRGQ